MLRYDSPVVGELPPVFLSSMHHPAYRGAVRSAAPTSAAWTTTNRIVYVPFYMSSGATVYRYFWLNGATVGTNNFQVGVYDLAFGAINRGTSTLSAGTANLCQFDNITDYYLPQGSYYMAMWGSGTTATVFTLTNIASEPQGIYYETNAGGLPTTGTPVDPAVTISGYRPVFGLALRATDP
jgi:hypothetical protein